MNPDVLIPVVIGGCVLIPVLIAISISNRFVRLESMVTNAWANVDVLLRRRHDLIPNLVETAKAYAKHEEEMMTRLVSLRERAEQATSVHEKNSVEGELASGVKGLLMRCEAYPELKSSAHFLQIQEELVNTEDRIAAARRFYNNNVREYNIAIESFPGSLLRGGRTSREFFLNSD